MTIYIALLRGINVGGKNIVKMTDLKRMFESMGFSRVQTYIQSGNILFESEEEEEKSLCNRIEHGIHTFFGLSAAVVVRTAEELHRIIGSCPFSEKEISEAGSSFNGECFYVALLAQVPPQEGIKRLDIYASEKDKYQTKGKEIYLLLHHSIRDSKLANNLHKLEVPMTVRNWKTLNKLAALAKGMEMC